MTCGRRRLIRTWMRPVAHDAGRAIPKGTTSLDAEATRALIQANLSNTRFEFIRISNLQTSAGEQSRRGTAEFRVFAKGSAEHVGRADGYRHVQLDLVARLPGDPAARLEGQPDHSRPDPERGPGHALRVTPFREPALRTATRTTACIGRSDGAAGDPIVLSHWSLVIGHWSIGRGRVARSLGLSSWDLLLPHAIG